MGNSISDQKSRYSRSFSVRTYESDHGGQLRLSGLLNYFQEAAGEHAERLGASISDLRRKQLTWVLSRYHLQISRYPAWKETVDLMTWPSVRQGLFAMREFELRDKKEDLLAAATSSWMLIDIKSKRPVPLEKHLAEFPGDPQRAIPDDFKSLPVSAKTEIELPFRVRMRDLDWNRHVNHTVYIEWAVETAPQELIEKLRPAELEVDFRGEAFYGDSVISRAEVKTLGGQHLSLHQIIRQENQKELTRLRVLWKE
jgi:acyl-ACP thioesterase